MTVRLAIDTSGAYCSVALVDANGKVFSESGIATGSHFEQLSSMVRRVSEAAALSSDGIQAVVIGAGPGSFTGLRIGFAYAKGLAWSLRVPLESRSSYAGAAHIAIDDSQASGAALVIGDARRGELFYQFFDRSGFGMEEPAIGAVEAVAERLVALESTGRRCVIASLDDAAFAGRPVKAIPNVAVAFLGTGPCDASFSVPHLAALAPNYLRAVAAKTIAERMRGGGA